MDIDLFSSNEWVSKVFEAKRAEVQTLVQVRRTIGSSAISSSARTIDDTPCWMDNDGCMILETV